MLKLILLMIAMIVTGFLLVHENWNITLIGFGYEITLSTVLLIVIIAIFFYLLSLIKKPFTYLFGFKNRRIASHLVKKEAYLTFVLETVLDQNNLSVNRILKQKKGLFQKKDIKHLLLSALFNPNKSVFEELSKTKETELAGLRGLYLIAKETGNIKEAEHLLDKARQNYSSVFWVLKESFEIATLQNDWSEALTLLEKLFLLKQVSKEEYTNQKAALLFAQGKIKEAYALDKTNPAIAISYAKENKERAKSILITSWNKEPSWDVYEAYFSLIKTLPIEKQLKEIQKLISKNKEFRISLIALADTAIKLEKWRLAKETLTAYLQSYPLTKKVAYMMADVSRKGWHHEQEAKEWEQKALETEDKYGWMCLSCNQKIHEWSPICPHCNHIGNITYR